MPNKALLIYKYFLVNVENIPVEKVHKKSVKKPIAEVNSDISPNNKQKPNNKRQYVDLMFHFVCILIGFEFSMMFTNWTTNSDNTFTSTDIIDSRTLWLRFGGTVAGFCYTLITSISNLVVKKRKRRAIK